MRFCFLIAVTLLTQLCVFGQNTNEIPKGYKVDTLLRESATHPGVYDTVITYRKVKVVHKKVYIKDKDTSSTNSPIKWRLAPIVGYSFGVENRAELSDSSSVIVSPSNKWDFGLSVSGKKSNWIIGSFLGISHLKQQWNYNYEKENVQLFESTVKDTVDVFYIENNSGSKDPFYVIKDRNIVLSDTTRSAHSYTFQNSVTFINAGINLGYVFEIGKWKVIPDLGYRIAVPVLAKGTSLTKSGNRSELKPGNLSSLINVISFSTSLAYSASPAIEVFLSGNYSKHLNNLYKINTELKFTFIGVKAGISVLLN